MRNITTVISSLVLSSAVAVGAWDAPLPFLAQPSGNDLAAFGNPAAAVRAEEAGTGFFLGRPDSQAGPWDRAWSMHHQENGHAFGLQLFEGGAKTHGAVSWSAGREVLSLGSTGIRASYLYREAGRDRLRADLGAQLRPHPAFLAGYWVEDFLAAGDRVHRMSAALRPMPAAGQRLGEVSIGYGMDIPEDGRRAEFLYAQSPLPGRVTAHARYEFGREAVSLGLTWQMTGQAAAAWGLRGPEGDATDWRGLKHREAGLRFRKAAKPGFALRPGPSRRVAELDLNHSIVEGETPQSWFGPIGDLGHLDLLRRFDVLEADLSVQAVALKLGRARTGWGIGEEIRGRILRLRARGKRVVAYMEQATPLNYYLASAADVIAVQPGGHFAVTGFSSEVMFYRGLFDKVGVEPQFLRHGKYKSFEEPYTRKDMSPEARADLESFQGSLWGHFLEAVSASRGLTRDSLARVLSTGEISLGPALRSGLVDTLVQEDEVLELAGGKGAGKAGRMPESLWRGGWEIPPRVAVIVVQGDMVMGRSSEGWFGSPELAGSRSVAEQLRRARLDSRVKAVVVRVESPGGSAQAADIMAREVDLLKEAGKPVVASVGHVAASGGYYLVCGADRILVAHNSAVGSIGILWGKFVLKGLYGKLGLATETVKTAPHADANSLSRAWDSSEVAMLQRHMDDFYERFLSRVAAGRKLTKAAADSLAQGRIFTGTQAVGNGLADRIGGLEDAVAEAARLAGIPDTRSVEVEAVPGRQGAGRIGGAWSLLRDPPGTGEDGALASLASWADRYRNLAEGQLLAVSPELSGWIGTGLR